MAFKGRPALNTFKAPRAYWAMWSNPARGVYNRIMRESTKQANFTVPHAPLMTKAQWRRVREEFATLAAFAADRSKYRRS